MALIDGYRSVAPDKVGPGYVKPGDMSKRCGGGDNGDGMSQQSGPDPYADQDEGMAGANRHSWHD